MDNPDNPMARPLSRAEEERLYGSDDQANAARERTLDAINSSLHVMFDLDVGESESERALIGLALQFAASGRDDIMIAAAVKQLLSAVVKRCDADYWDDIDGRTRRINAAWSTSNSIASMACGLNVRVRHE